MRKPTVRQRKFVNGVIAGKTYSTAAIDAGFKQSEYGSVLMKNEVVQKLLVQKMEQAGITDELLARKIMDGLEAKTLPRGKDGARYDDQPVRKQFLDIVFKIRGDYAPEKIESTEKKLTIIIDSNMVTALKDSKVLTSEEIKYLEHEPIRDAIDVIPEKVETNENKS